MVRTIVSLLLLISYFVGTAQVETSIDTTSVKIGEKLNYQLKVTTDTSGVVSFPKTKQLGTWNVISQTSKDTLLKKNIKEYVQTYELINFSAGNKIIPSQEIIVQNKKYVTDSLLVEVRDIPVDTINKKFFENKDYADVSGYFFSTSWIVLLVAFALCGFTIYLTIKKSRRYRNLDNGEKGKSPLEKVIHALENANEIKKDGVEKSKFYRDYYTQITYAFRRYLEEELGIASMEVTFNELKKTLDDFIKNQGKSINKELFKRFEDTLYISGLVKFAKIIPPKERLSQDATVMREMILEIREHMRGFIEQKELEEQRKKEEKKKYFKKKWNYIVGLGSFVSLMVLVVGFTFFFGFHKMQGFFTSNDSKVLVKEAWITSSYGNPPITLSTPKVLVRQTNKTDSTSVHKESFFVYDDLLNSIQIKLSFISTKQLTTQAQGISQEQISKMLVETLIYENIQKEGGKSIVIKEEDFTTKEEGVEGKMIYGEFKISKNNKDTKIAYYHVLLPVEGYIISLHIAYPKENKYSLIIKDRILNAISLKKD